MVEAKGPVFAGNIEEFVVSEGGKTYRILYLPDKNNEELQKAGKSPHFYWVPGQVRLARNAEGHAKFSLLKFQGEMSEETHTGVEGEQSIAGGRLTLTTTTKPPDGILKKSHEKLRQRFRGKDDKYWGIKTDKAPQFGVVPIGSNQTTISNISPQSDGSVPTLEGGAGGGGGGPGGGGGGPGGGGGGDGRGERSGPRTRPPDEEGGEAEGGRPGTGSESEPTTGGAPETNGAAVTGPETPSRNLIDTSGSVPSRGAHDSRGSSLDMWFERMDGEGAGSIDPAAENAFSATLGMVPTSILWEGFKGQYSPITVTQWMKLKVWSETIHLKITGDWERIRKHFSSHASHDGWFFEADVKAQVDKLIQNGDIEVELSIDGTTPGGDKKREEIQKRIDLITKKFMNQAKDVIFGEPKEIKPAEASGGGGIFSTTSVALKVRHESREVNLTYEETVDERFLRDHVISSSLEGFYDEIKADPEAADRYFKKLPLGDMFRKVKRVASPVVNWGDPAKDWVGEPVDFMSVQVGYPDTSGDIMWEGQVFDKNNESPAEFEYSRKDADDVDDPPDDWDPDKTFLKRRVHFEEPEIAGGNQYSTVEIEKEIAELDPGERGSLVTDIANEVRADNAGKGYLGPMFLDVELENSKQYVEVAIKADGKTLDGEERTWTRFAWNYDDQNEPRHWMLFTGDPEFTPSFKYQVRVIVKGTIFSDGQEWLGPKETVKGNGTLTLHVPTPEEAVDTRSLTTREAAGVDPIPATRGEMAVSEPTRAGTAGSGAAHEPASGDRARGEAGGGEEVRPPTGRQTLGQAVEESDRKAGDGGERGGGSRSEREQSAEREAFSYSDAHGWNVQ